MALTIERSSQNFAGVMRSQSTATNVAGLATFATISAADMRADFINLACSGTATQGAIGKVFLNTATGEGQVVVIGKTTTATGTANVFIDNDGNSAATGLFVVNATDHVIKAQSFAGEWHVVFTNCTQATAT